MAFVVEHFRCYVAKTSSEGRELFFRGMQVLGTWRACVSVLITQNSRITTTYMPKSAMTISDDGSLVRYKMFSGLALRLNHFDGQKKRCSVLEISVHDIVFM